MKASLELSGKTHNNMLRNSLLAAISIAALQLIGCSANNPNRGYAKLAASVPATKLPPGGNMGKLPGLAYYPVPQPTAHTAMVPTVSTQPPGNQFINYVKAPKLQPGAAPHAMLKTYMTSGSNGAPILVIGRDFNNSWGLVANALTRQHYRIMARDKSLATFMVTAPQGAKRSHQPLPLYGVHLVSSGVGQTAISISYQQRAVSNSKAILQAIKAALV